MTITLQDAVLRLITAMLIGALVGSEREGNHRPAGLRTHMLVALGACIVMLTGQLMWIDFTALGGKPDPARLAAQVIPGVGFLGAGTILREGFSIKGLTTAASLWAMACMGLCVGAGFYAAGICCAAAVFITLSVFRMLQSRMLGDKDAILTVMISCPDGSTAISGLHAVAKRFSAQIEDLEQTRRDGKTVINFKVRFIGGHRKQRRMQFLCQLRRNTGAEHMDSIVEATV